MPKDRTEYFRKYGKKWYRDIVVPRRAKWFEENGPCAKCGSWDNLELDHIDRTTKVTHAVWSWSEKKRSEELEKCQVLCCDCHRKKSVQECFDLGVYGANKKDIVDGKTWCKDCQAYVLVENFDKDKYAVNGCYSVCKPCRRRLPSRAAKRVEEFLALVA